MQALIQKAKMISRFKKERFLRQMSEEEFRDRVIRPLLLRRGFQDGRDMCGPSEKGKDSVFLSKVRSLGSDLFIDIKKATRSSLDMERVPLAKCQNVGPGLQYCKRI